MRAIVLITLSTMLYAGCTSDDDESDAGPVKIGLLVPRDTGFGVGMERIATVALDSINAKGGIDGRRLELVATDTTLGTATVAADLQALIDDGAIAAVGPTTSGQVAAAWPVARDNQIPIIAPASTAAELSLPPPAGPDDDGYVFRTMPDDTIQSIAMAHFLRKVRQPAVPSVVVVHESTLYGMGLAEAFRARFTSGASPGTIQAEIAYAQNLPDDAAARAVIDQVAALEPAPSMVVLLGVEPDAIKLTTAWDNGGAPVVPGLEFFMSHGARTTGFLAEAPASVRGMCGSAATYPNNGLAYRVLKDAYEQRYDGTLEAILAGPNVWDAFHLIAAAAIRQSHTFPGEPLRGPHLRDAIGEVSHDGQIFTAGDWRDLVGAIRGGHDVDYDGAAGPVDFDPAGQTIGAYEIWCVAGDGAAFDQLDYFDANAMMALRKELDG